MIIRKGLFFFAFLLVAAVLGFCALAGGQIYHYFRLTKTAQATMTCLEILPRNENKYYLNGEFFFEHEGKIIHSKSCAGGPFPNPWAAELGVKSISQKMWKVWFDPQAPNNATLEKNFPYKLALSAFSLLGIMIYFIFLSYYVYRKGAHAA